MRKHADRQATAPAMKIRIVIEFDPVTDSYSAVCPDLPGCTSAGDTDEETRYNIEEAIGLYQL